MWEVTMVFSPMESGQFKRKFITNILVYYSVKFLYLIELKLMRLAD